MHTNQDKRLYLGLDSITINEQISFPEMGKVAADALVNALNLYSIKDLKYVKGRVLSLSINVFNANKGCHITRSSNLFSMLGFGNARLYLHIKVEDAETNELLITYSEHLRHSGRDKDWQHYLEDNGEGLIKDLAVKGAYRIGYKIHNTMSRNQDQLGFFKPVTFILNKYFS